VEGNPFNTKLLYRFIITQSIENEMSFVFYPLFKLPGNEEPKFDGYLYQKTELPKVEGKNRKEFEYLVILMQEIPIGKYDILATALNIPIERMLKGLDFLEKGKYENMDDRNLGISREILRVVLLGLGQKITSPNPLNESDVKKVFTDTDFKNLLPERLDRLNEKQKEALFSGLNTNMTLIRGVAGTGKTRIASSLAFLFHKLQQYPDWKQGKVLMTAPSNKAIEILAQAMKDFKDKMKITLILSLKKKLVNSVKKKMNSVFQDIHDMILDNKVKKRVKNEYEILLKKFKQNEEQNKEIGFKTILEAEEDQAFNTILDEEEDTDFINVANSQKRDIQRFAALKEIYGQ